MDEATAEVCVMVSPIFTVVIFLLNLTYSKGITLGAPDTVKILVDPIKVIERNDTIYVLDQERGSRIVKQYTLDGFFIEARAWVPADDSVLFTQSTVDPTPAKIKRANELARHTSSVHIVNTSWNAMHVESDSTIWLTCGCWDGDASWMAIVAFNEQDSSFRIAGYGPGSGDFDVTSVRHDIGKNFFFHVGKRYVYIIVDELLWQYDRQARFVREIGITPNQCFKEPCGIAIDNHGFFYITDFRLGKIWVYRPGGRTLRLTPMIVSEDIRPETPTFLAYSQVSGLWVTDIEYRLAKNIQFNEALRSLNIDKMDCWFKGAISDMAATDSLLLVRCNSGVYAYGILGGYLKNYQGTDCEGKQDGVVGLDNCGNVYLFTRGKDWRGVHFCGIRPESDDTFNIFAPDSFESSRLEWSKCYRVGDTVYLLGRHPMFYEGGHSPNLNGFFIFVNDSLKYILDKSEFEGGLPKHITDFVVDSKGSIWIIDIENRIVQEYRPIKQ